MKKIISTKNAPAAIGPYSQGVDAGSFVFFSGQIALDPKTGEMIKGTITDETKQVFDNIFALLRAANLAFGDVVKTTVFLVDMADFAEVNAEYAKYFGTNPPARSCVAVGALPKNARVEIEVIGLRQN